MFVMFVRQSCVRINTCAGDSEQSCLSHRDNSSIYNSQSKSTCQNKSTKIFDSDDFYEEATIKKPKKHFSSEQERENFIKQYQMKFKTEMCRNWELFGKCKFQTKCSFAHGEHELMKKVHLP